MKRVLLLCSIISLGAANAVITENEMQLLAQKEEQRLKMVQLEERIAELEPMGEQNNQLSRRNEALLTQITENQQVMEAKENTIKQLIQQADGNQTTIQGLIKQVDENKTTIEEQMNNIVILNQQITQHVTTISSQDREIKELSLQLTEQKQNIEEKTAQIETQSEQLVQNLAKIDALSKQIEELQQQLSVSQVVNNTQNETIEILRGIKDKTITTQGIISKINMETVAREQFNALQIGVRGLIGQWFQTDKNETIFVPHKPNKINEKDCSDVLLCIPLYQRLAGYGMATYYRSVFAKMFIEKLKKKAGDNIFEVTNEEQSQHAKEREIFRGIVEELVIQGAPEELADEACRNSGSEFTCSKYISSDILYGDVDDSDKLVALKLRALIGYRLCLLAVLVESAERGTIGLINGAPHKQIDASGCAYSNTALIKTDITQRKKERCKCFYKTPRGYDGHTLWAMIKAIEGVLCGKLDIPTP